MSAARTLEPGRVGDVTEGQGARQAAGQGRRQGEALHVEAEAPKGAAAAQRVDRFDAQAEAGHPLDPRRGQQLVGAHPPTPEPWPAGTLGRVPCTIVSTSRRGSASELLTTTTRAM